MRKSFKQMVESSAVGCLPQVSMMMMMMMIPDFYSPFLGPEDLCRGFPKYGYMFSTYHYMRSRWDRDTGHHGRLVRSTTISGYKPCGNTDVPC
jgi:hypothetical protein